MKAKLPREIRDMVYKYISADSEHAILVNEIWWVMMAPIDEEGKRPNHYLSFIQMQSGAGFDIGLYKTRRCDIAEYKKVIWNPILLEAAELTHHLEYYKSRWLLHGSVYQRGDGADILRREPLRTYGS